MNSNLLQTILTALLTISGIATSILLSVGCQDIAGSISCVASNAPTWLVPYLGIAASVLGIVKLVLAAFNGKLTAPTVVVSDSGKAGTVTPAQVASGPK